MSSDHAPARDNSLERLLFFSDGVFAIAITLLSIELHPPHDWNGTAADLLNRGWPALAAYALSFLVIGVFWTSHRRIFNQIRRYGQGVFLWNLLLLGLIALMPFVTNLLYSGGSEAFAIYLATVAAAGLAQGAMLAWAVFVARSVDPEISVARRLSAILSAGLLPGLMSGASLFLFGAMAGGDVPLWLPVSLGVAAGVVILFRSWAERGTTSPPA